MPRGDAILQVDTIEGRSPAEYNEAATLYDSTALDPEPMIRLEHSPTEFTTRIIDILAPIGFGQRGLIVAPPRSGKTMLLQNIAAESITTIPMCSWSFCWLTNGRKKSPT